MRQTLTLLLLLVGSTAWAVEPPKPPNIVFCFADDWGRYASCYAALDAKPTANSVVKTPNIDAVANRGVIFRNAFVPAPSCTRAAVQCSVGGCWRSACDGEGLSLREASIH